MAEAIGCSLATTKRALAKAQERVNAIVKRDPLLAPYAREATDDASESPSESEEMHDAAQGD